MAKIFGGSASRLEMYGLFVAAVVLIGGGIGGAIVVTSSDSKPAEVTQVSVDTTVVDTSIPPTTAPPAAEGTTSPTTAAQRYYNPEPQAPVTSYPNQPVQSVTPQPVQDYSAYCTMPNLVGMRSEGNSFVSTSVSQAMEASGCRIADPQGRFGSYCVSDSLNQPGAGFPSYRVLSQTPSPGTLIHRTLGTFSYFVAYHPNSPSFIYGTTLC
jgi:hypothetical protein